MRAFQGLLGLSLASLFASQVACGGDDKAASETMNMVTDTTDTGKDPSKTDTTDTTDTTQMMETMQRSDPYEPQLLEAYRAVLPTEDNLRAPAPGETTDASALTRRGDAELANLAIKSAIDINKPAVAVVLTLRALTKVEPTLYNSETKEFVWGPWDNNDGFGKVLAYVKENATGDDFKYGYALVRMLGNDLNTMIPVIWGGANPATGTDDTASGVTLWDFVANHNFDLQNDPTFDAQKPYDKGRFAMLYGKGENTDGKFAFNVAVFRDFASKDDPTAKPADLDYFYGHFKGNQGDVLDFVDWNLVGNMCEAEPETCFKDPAAGQDETLRLRAAFFNRGPGRAEALVSGGDLNVAVNTVECWDENIDRTGISYSVDGDTLAQDGECGGAFESDLQALGVPQLSDIDAAILAQLQCVASMGLEACEKKK